MRKREREEEDGRRRKEEVWKKEEGEVGKEEEEEEVECENEAFSPMAETKFDRVTKKTIEKGEMIKFVLVTIKFKVQRLKTLVYENKKKLREREELLNKAKKLALSMEKGKVKKKTIEEYYE